jgi:hypothetical protein
MQKNFMTLWATMNQQETSVGSRRDREMPLRLKEKL